MIASVDEHNGQRSEESGYGRVSLIVDGVQFTATPRNPGEWLSILKTAERAAGAINHETDQHRLPHHADQRH